MPSAHYASPVIVPTTMVLCAGWLGILRMFEKMTHISFKVLASLYMLFLVWLEIYSIASIVIYYKVFSY